MNLNLINLNKNLSELHISNTTIFYLYYKKYKSKTFYKSYNKIRGSYKDLVVKNTIYISSNGLKKTGIFAKYEFNSNVLQPKFDSFVCYFGLLEDNFFKFTFYSQFYLKKLRRKYLINSGLINSIIKKIEESNVLLKSFNKLSYKFPINNIIFFNQKNNWYGNSNKVVIVKKTQRWYKKWTKKWIKNKKRFKTLKWNITRRRNQRLNIKRNWRWWKKPRFFLTESGCLFKLRKKNFSIKRFFGKWMRFRLKRYYRKMYFRILRHSYKLLKFYSQIILIKTKHPKLSCNLILYLKYLNFLKVRFNKFWKKRKLYLKLKYKGWKFCYFEKFYKKINKFVSFFYLIGIKKYLFNLTKCIWIKNLFFNKLYNMFNKDNDEIIKYKFLYRINSINFENRFKLISFLDLFINLKLINFIKFYTSSLSFLSNYYTIKSLILDQYSKNFNENCLFFRISKGYDNIYDLFILKNKNIVINVYNIYKSMRYLRTFYLKNKFKFKKSKFKRIKLNFSLKKRFERQLFNFLFKKKYNLIAFNIRNFFLKFFYNKIMNINILKKDNILNNILIYSKNKFKNIYFYIIKYNFNLFMRSQLFYNQFTKKIKPLDNKDWYTEYQKYWYQTSCRTKIDFKEFKSCKKFNDITWEDCSKRWTGYKWYLKQCWIKPNQIKCKNDWRKLIKEENLKRKFSQI